MDDKKKYVKPEAEIIDLFDDIITMSLVSNNDADWDDDDNTEVWG